MKHSSVKAFSAMVILLGAVAAGCSDGKEPAASDPGSPSPSAGGNEATASKKPAERVKISMFMSNSGLTYPEGVDPNNNEFINIVKDLANVDMELTVPTADDFATKLNLMLASNKLPDIVHTNTVDPVNKAAAVGAFLDLKKYYDNSPIMKKWITPTMMEMAKYNGHYYRIPMAWDKAPQGGGNYVRMDLLRKYNNGKYPATVDEYVEVLRKIKKDNPESVPLTAYSASGKVFLGGQGFFQWYGARPNEFRVQDGKVTSTFVLPEYRAAVELYRQLYSEGILDKEFATNDWGKWYANLAKDTLIVTDTADQLLPLAVFHKQSKGTASDTSNRSEIVFAPALTSYPSVLKDPKYTYMKQGSPIIFHGVYISSKTKDPDRAWKVLEAFASDQLNQAIFWGKEGSEYVVKDGVRIPDAAKLADPKRYWSLQLSIIPGFLAGQDSKVAQQKQALGDGFDLPANSLKTVADLAEKAGVDMFSLIPALEEVSLKLPESDNFISGATVEAIMGKISMENFDKKVSEYKTKYAFIADAYTKYMNEHKTELSNWGVKEVNW